MLVDVVIDTNVLMHASNVNSGRAKEAVQLLKALLPTETVLCVDARFSGDEVQPSTSLIMKGEYEKHLHGTSLGSSFLVTMVSEGRILYLSRDVSNSVRKWINQRVHNKRDRTFLRVAVNSREKVLVSHDFDDFPSTVRSDCHQHLNVDVLDSREACTRVDNAGTLESTPTVDP